MIEKYKNQDAPFSDLKQKYENVAAQNVGRQITAPKQDTAIKPPSIATGYDPAKHRTEGQAGWNAYLEHTKQRMQNAVQAEEKPLWERLMGYLGDVGPVPQLQHDHRARDPVNRNKHQLICVLWLYKSQKD